jgi:hypothetical protein
MKSVGIGLEAEGPGRSDLLAEGFFPEEECPELAADPLVLELDGGRHPETVPRSCHVELPRLQLHRDRF